MIFAFLFTLLSAGIKDKKFNAKKKESFSFVKNDSP